MPSRGTGVSRLRLPGFGGQAGLKPQVSSLIPPSPSVFSVANLPLHRFRAAPNARMYSSRNCWMASMPVTQASQSMAGRPGS
jgi:hypothetical protein